ncbi:MAG: CoA-acylating methylmalonate-semialdehyde dehydrogenase [Deltaproteobacteria bacterium]|nr:CoA-acylating methylmalonate-semialdehyde dehydrogenase [Deltaproteobacteria bacterium]
MAHLPEVKKHYGVLKNYIDGEWVESKAETKPVINPAKNEEVARVPMSSVEELNTAVAAAKDAFQDWRETAPISRVRVFFKLKELMEKRFEDFSRVLVQEMGKTIDESRGEVRRAIENVETACSITTLQMGYCLEDGAASGIDEEAYKTPLGVFACIAPYNFPSMIPYWFWPYAVATGNTYIIKPSSQVPCTQQIMMEAVHEAGFPDGVINLVNGSHALADALMSHPDIKGISFVGSTPIAHHVYKMSSEYKKRVQAQGGAKNTIVIMPDCDIRRSVANMLASFYGCAGQRCLAGANLAIVGGDDFYRKFMDEFIAGAKNIQVGYGLDEATNMGPLVSQKAKTKVEGYIQKTADEGAKLILDGRGIKPEGYENGAFVGPTIFEGVTEENTIAWEEVFGPVVGVMRFGKLDEAMEFMNRSPFGNAASLYTSSGPAARKFRYEMNAGNIGINIGIVAAMSYFPFAGMKDSFLGDLHGQGMDAVDFFTDRKVVITRWF